jgi:hypothetical protein
MSITLDTLTLPAGLRWVDRWAPPDLLVTTRRRLDGGQVVYPRTLSGGRPITLEAPSDQPITVAQADALIAMAAVVDGTYTLALHDHGLTSVSVRFRWEDAPPLDLALLIEYADPAADDPVVGTIKFITL